MIKRDTIRRYAANAIEDAMGGRRAEYEPKEVITANVSVNATFGEITQYGIKQEMVLHVVTNIALDEYVHTRYEYSNKMFKLMRQIKQGNEYYSTLVEINKGD